MRREAFQHWGVWHSMSYTMSQTASFPWRNCSKLSGVLHCCSASLRQGLLLYELHQATTLALVLWCIMASSILRLFKPMYTQMSSLLQGCFWLHLEAPVMTPKGVDFSFLSFPFCLLLLSKLLGLSDSFDLASEHTPTTVFVKSAMASMAHSAPPGHTFAAALQVQFDSSISHIPRKQITQPTTRVYNMHSRGTCLLLQG